MGSDESTGHIDESEIDDDLLIEWDRLAEKESDLELKLDRIEDAILKKYPEIETARIIVSDIRFLTHETPIRRQLVLLRMERRAVQLVESAKREIANKQWSVKLELKAIKELIVANDEKIKDQVMKSRAKKSSDNANFINQEIFEIEFGISM